MPAKYIIGWMLLVGLCTYSTTGAHAQRRSTVGNQGPSVTVQLPTFHYFGTSTSVLVPDRGAAYNGGINRSSSGQVSRGTPLFPWANRAFSRSAAAANTSTSAWIHDLQAMDEQLLNQASGNLTLQGSSTAGGSSRETDSGPALLGVKAYERQRSAAESKLQQEAEQHFAKAKSMVSQGKPGVAKIYFQMALRRAEEPLRSEIAAQLAEVSGTNIAVEK